VTTGMRMVNRSNSFAFRPSPADIYTDKDFTSTSSTGAFQLALVVSIPSGSVTDFTVNATAVFGTEAASWRDLRATYLRRNRAFATAVGQKSAEQGQPHLLVVLPIG
jgi:hypothetical protein